eukprot:SAG31_NODE_1634_length_7683_cov_10.287843_7_plen_160_part_00
MCRATAGRAVCGPHADHPRPLSPHCNPRRSRWVSNRRRSVFYSRIPLSSLFYSRIPLLILDSSAGFLIGAGGAEHSYLMYGTSWTSDKGWPWSPLFDLEYGKPLGAPKRSEVAGGNVVWERKFASGAVATVTCPPKSSSCPGNITGITIPPAPTAAGAH